MSAADVPFGLAVDDGKKLFDSDSFSCRKKVRLDKNKYTQISCNISVNIILIKMAINTEVYIAFVFTQPSLVVGCNHFRDFRICPKGSLKIFQI